MLEEGLLMKVLLLVSPSQKTFASLVDTIDGGYGAGDEPLTLPSSLPGLRRSAYLTSQTQLNNLVGQ